MARTAIAYADVSKTGVALPTETAADVANGNSMPNDGRVILIVRNANGASTARVLSLGFTGTVDGYVPAARTYSVAAGTSKVIGPFETSKYGTSLALNGDNAELKITGLRLPG